MLCTPPPACNFTAPSGLTQRSYFGQILYHSPKFLLTLLLIGLSSLRILAEPSGRGFDPNVPDIGLPGGNEVLTGLIIAIIAIPIGYLILNGEKNKYQSHRECRV